jgi:hypothetical protein
MIRKCKICKQNKETKYMNICKDCYKKQMKSIRQKQFMV